MKRSKATNDPQTIHSSKRSEKRSNTNKLPQDRKGSLSIQSRTKGSILRSKTSNRMSLNFFDAHQALHSLRKADQDPVVLLPSTKCQLSNEITSLRESLDKKKWKNLAQSIVNIKQLQSKDSVVSKQISQQLKDGENLLIVGITKKAPLYLLQQIMDIICPNSTSYHNSNRDRKPILLAQNDDTSGDSCLHIACANGISLQTINWLLSIGQKQATFQKNKFGFTPLHVACSSGASYDIVEALIENGGHDIVMEVNHNNQTPLHLACSRSNASLEIVQKLIQLGNGRDYVRKEGNDGRNALHLSYMNGAPMDVIMYILKIGGKDMLLDINKQGLNHLQLACLNGASNDIIKRFVQIGGKELVLGHFDDWENPLLLTCTNNEISLDVLQEFVAVGGEEIVEKHNEYGENILHLICSKESISVDVIRYLGQIGNPNLFTEMIDGYNVIHLVCMNAGSNTELFQALVKIAGEDMLLKKDKNNGYNALHILTRNNPSLETLKYILETGGDELLLAEDFRGNNPLHLACECLDSNFIDVFVEFSNLEVISAVNFRKKTPLDVLLSKRDRVPLDKVNSIQTKWFQLDKHSNSVPTITNANLLTWARQLNDDELTLALDYGLLKSIMNKNFVQPINIALLMTDLYVQIATAVVYSFLIHPTITGKASSDVPRNVLLVSFCWFAFREFNEIFKAKSLYLLESLNYADLLQLVLVMWTILLFDGGEVNQVERIVYTLATGVSCLQLLKVFGNLSYPIAVFIIALIKIFWILIPFIVSTFLIVISFAHMFYMWSISSLDICAVNDNSTPNQELNWTCNLSSSYAQTFSILITSNWSFLDEEAEGFQTSISYAFAFIVGILLLNVLIAVINNAFSTIERSGDLEYWRYRLSFENETQFLYSIGVTFVRPLKRVMCDGFSLLFKYKSVNVTEHDTKKNKENKLPQRPRLGAENRVNSMRDYFFTESSFEDPMYQTVTRIRFDNFSLDQFNVLLESDQKQFFEWWYNCNENSEIPSFKCRLLYYFTRASWDEIIFPGQSFENIIMGIKFREDGSGMRFIFARIFSYMLFILNIIILIMLFIVGMLTFGICWPMRMKERLFFGPLATNQKNEISRLKTEMEHKMKLIHDEVAEVKDSFLKISSKQDELIKVMAANQAQAMELISLLQSANEKSD